MTVRTLVTHPMQIVRRDKAGKVIDKNYNFIYKVTATYNGKQVLEVETTQSVSQNPLFAFPLKVDEPGTLKISFSDTHGKTYEGTAQIKF
ncbi:MAG: thiosulfate oxidation carrier complex protein SoxZ [Akkermansiaceae bacterium]|nr:thiosulfate oxidation carrier complex protein SoxZ [Akkermansiaceae bacterium]